MSRTLNELQAVMLLTKHLGTLLPVLVAFRRVPVVNIRRIGLLEVTARTIAENPEIARDWYTAMQLLEGDDLSGKSVGELLLLAFELAERHKLHEVWQAAFSLNLLDEDTVKHWTVFEGLTDVDANSNGTR